MNVTIKYSTNCLICNNDKPYLYLGNCYTNCRYGDFIDNGIKQCICHNPFRKTIILKNFILNKILLKVYIMRPLL